MWQSDVSQHLHIMGAADVHESVYYLQHLCKVSAAIARSLFNMCDKVLVSVKVNPTLADPLSEKACVICASKRM